MKKLGKLSINQSKLLKNEELVNLKGGYSSYNLCAYCWCKDSSSNLLGPAILTMQNLDECEEACDYLYGSAVASFMCQTGS